jgi:hypothetical protein
MEQGRENVVDRRQDSNVRIEPSYEPRWNMVTLMHQVIMVMR